MMKDVDVYIDQFPDEVKEILRQMRELIKTVAPDVTEGISYGMPAYKTDGKPLVYFAAYKNHIGFYAIPTGHKKFEKELAEYKHGKGSVQFPIDTPIPYELIKRMVKFRLSENEMEYGKT